MAKIRVFLIRLVTASAMVVPGLATGDVAVEQSRAVPPVRVLMIVGGDYHDYVTLPGKLADNLEHRGGVQFEIVGELAELTPERIAASDVLLFNDCRQDEIAESVRRSIIGHVESGGGLIVMHCSMWSYQWWPEWTPLVGGFAPGHDRYTTFPVTVLDRGHAVTQHQPHRFEITDEPYIVNRREKDAKVLIRTSDIRKDMKQELRESPEPQVWTRQQGKGRVLAVTFGHDEKGQTNPHFLTLMHDGILWAAGRAQRPVNNVLSDEERGRGGLLMFDGQRLSGWESEAKGVWHVRDGAIVGEPNRDAEQAEQQAAQDYLLRYTGAGAILVDLEGSETPVAELKFSICIELDSVRQGEPLAREHRRRWWKILRQQGIAGHPEATEEADLNEILKSHAVPDGWNEVILGVKPDRAEMALNGKTVMQLALAHRDGVGERLEFRWVLPKKGCSRILLRNIRYLPTGPAE